MVDLWTTLLPLVIGSAVAPTQIVVTGVLLRSSRGKAVAWIAGMAGLRVLQGVLFGLVFAEARSHATSAGGPRILASGLLLAIAVLFYATALRQAIAGDDAAAAPAPQWLSRVESMPGVAAFGAGAAYVALSPRSGSSPSPRSAPSPTPRSAPGRRSSTSQRSWPSRSPPA